MIESDDTNKLIEFHSNLVREKESNNCTLFASCCRTRTRSEAYPSILH